MKARGMRHQGIQGAEPTAGASLRPVLLLVGFVLLVRVASILMTIDGPDVACWAVACGAFWQSFLRGRTSFFALAGAAIGLGFLFKYTALLLVPGLVLYVLLARRTRTVQRERGSRRG